MQRSKYDRRPGMHYRCARVGWACGHVLIIGAGEQEGKGNITCKTMHYPASESPPPMRRCVEQHFIRPIHGIFYNHFHRFLKIAALFVACWWSPVGLGLHWVTHLLWNKDEWFIHGEILSIHFATFLNLWFFCSRFSSEEERGAPRIAYRAVTVILVENLKPHKTLLTLN